MSIIDDDIISNVSNNQTFEQVLHARVSRRSVLGGGVTAAIGGGADGCATCGPTSWIGPHWTVPR